ncbi:MAG TPA: IclR family transcriptional regulator [Nitrolancea sp.]|nr:IclR family transcriptional regulator [Nitrolancea sp.]
MPQTLGSLRKALLLIDELARDGGDLGVSELSRRLGLAKNQVFRILKTLEEFDYIQQNDDKTYTLSYRFSEIGMGMLGKDDLAQQAAAAMDSLRDHTCETVNLCVRSGLQAVCIAKRESTSRVRMSAQVGRRFLPHAGACPKAIFAFQDPDVVTSAIHRYGLPQYTHNTITNTEELSRHFQLIRDQGYSESNEDIDEYVYAIGVPVYDRDGKVSAAISVAGPMFRFSEDIRHKALTQLLESANRISTQRGFNGD